MRYRPSIAVRSRRTRTMCVCYSGGCGRWSNRTRDCWVDCRSIGASTLLLSVWRGVCSSTTTETVVCGLTSSICCSRNWTKADWIWYWFYTNNKIINLITWCNNRENKYISSSLYWIQWSNILLWWIFIEFSVIVLLIAWSK